MYTYMIYMANYKNKETDILCYALEGDGYVLDIYRNYIIGLGILSGNLGLSLGSFLGIAAGTGGFFIGLLMLFFARGFGFSDLIIMILICVLMGAGLGVIIAGILTILLLLSGESLWD